jgi:hypothetical protein
VRYLGASLLLSLQDMRTSSPSAKILIMSSPTKNHPTKSLATLKKEFEAKLSQVTNMDDLITLNELIDKFLPRDEERSLSPSKAFRQKREKHREKLSREKV